VSPLPTVSKCWKNFFYNVSENISDYQLVNWLVIILQIFLVVLQRMASLLYNLVLCTERKLQTYNKILHSKAIERKKFSLAVNG